MCRFRTPLASALPAPKVAELPALNQLELLERGRLTRTVQWKGLLGRQIEALIDLAVEVMILQLRSGFSRLVDDPDVWTVVAVRVRPNQRLRSEQALQ